MTLINITTDKHCFKACDKETIKNGLCECNQRFKDFKSKEEEELHNYCISLTKSAIQETIEKLVDYLQQVSKKDGVTEALSLLDDFCSDHTQVEKNKEKLIALIMNPDTPFDIILE